MSVIVNLLQNSFACYMKLGHFKEAGKCAAYIRQLQPDYVKTYLLESQLAYFNRAAKLHEVRAALKVAKEGAALAGLAVANTQTFLGVLRQMEKTRELLEGKIE